MSRGKLWGFFSKKIVFLRGCRLWAIFVDFFLKVSQQDVKTAAFLLPRKSFWRENFFSKNFFSNNCSFWAISLEPLTNVSQQGCRSSILCVQTIVVREINFSVSENTFPKGVFGLRGQNYWTLGAIFSPELNNCVVRVQNKFPIKNIFRRNFSVLESFFSVLKIPDFERYICGFWSKFFYRVFENEFHVSRQFFEGK